MSIFWATLSAVVSVCTPAGPSDAAEGATWTVPNPPEMTLKMFLPERGTAVEVQGHEVRTHVSGR